VLRGELPADLVPGSREPTPELTEVEIVSKEQDMEVGSNPSGIFATFTVLEL